jgi:HD-GYP domain-containing protein (c-di-GMP phosphodiesterase class II)
LKLLGALAHDYPVFNLLGLTSLAFVTASGLFGWAGLAGATVYQLAFIIYRQSPWDYILLSTPAYAAAGALIFLTFRYLPRIGRGFPDLRTVRWYGLASGLGVAVTSTVITAFFSDDFPQSLATWFRSTLVSVWVFGPFLLITGWWFLEPWLAPIPGEAEPPVRRRYSLARRPDGSLPPGVAPVVSRPEPSIGRSFLVGLGLIVGVALLALVLSEWIPAAGYWAGLLYLLPIYWAADRHRLGGALASAAGVGLAIMTVQAIARGGEALAMTLEEEIQIYAYLLGFLLIAILLGVARERESDLLERLADSNRRLRGDLQRVVRALTGAVEAKDSYTEGHLQRVSTYALEVGRRLGLRNGELELLQIASALHDIGKIGIPEHILNKPDRLDPAERVIIERHPEIGARSLESVEGLEAAAPLVRYHQERWDGGQDGDFPGYPDGLEAEAIPLGARIIAVVDAFDAMTTDRAYRAARPTERAVAVLQDERGRQFDPRVVDVFLELLAERPWA